MVYGDVKKNRRHPMKQTALKPLVPLHEIFYFYVIELILFTLTLLLT